MISYINRQTNRNISQQITIEIRDSKKKIIRKKQEKNMIIFELNFYFYLLFNSALLFDFFLFSPRADLKTRLFFSVRQSNSLKN
jgi:hypothetical protein